MPAHTGLILFVAIQALGLNFQLLGLTTENRRLAGIGLYLGREGSVAGGATLGAG